ncbi:FtsW/RodA/SpoVE family cell cycle protein [Prolixibacteraceae bacterium]|nr:FtsW/RodA/SpoVE family cell cycle protein [Prolixibacteraceae bacterium]
MKKFLSQFTQLFQGDKGIWSIVILLSILSIPILLSSGGRLAYNIYQGAYLQPGIKHGVYILLGFAIMVATIYLPITIFGKLSIVINILVSSVLMLGLFLSSGSEQTGRSLDLGGISFQVTEFAKLALIYTTAYFIGTGQRSEPARNQAFYKIIISTVGIAGIIFLADFSTSFILCCTIFVMMLVGRMPYKKIGALVLFGVMAFTILILISDFLPMKVGRISTVKSRIMSYVDGTEITKDHHMRQVDYAKVAIARGGIKGTADKSLVSNFLSASHNDFVYAMSIEFGGITLGFLIWFSYVVFFIRCFKIMIRCEKVFPAMLVCGIATLYVLQAFTNMAVSLNIIPVTGQPLPFISLGGSSVIATSLGVGIIQNIAYRSKIATNKVTVPKEDNAIINEVRRIENKYAYLNEDDDIDFD